MRLSFEQHSPSGLIYRYRCRGRCAASLQTIGASEAHFGSRLAQKTLGSVTGVLPSGEIPDSVHEVSSKTSSIPGKDDAVQHLERLLSHFTAGTSDGQSEGAHFGGRAVWSAVRGILPGDGPANVDSLESMRSSLDPGRLVQGIVERVQLSTQDSFVFPAPDILAQYGATLRSEFETHVSSSGISGHSWSLLVPLIIIAAAATWWSTPKSAGDASSDPEPDLLYSADKVKAYWQQRPVAVGRRLVKVGSEALFWGFGYGVDKLTNSVRQNAAKRAIRLRQALERLGPAYVKIAQAVSTRVDLLEPEYLLEIERLQDKVPPFPTSLAEAIIQRALGRPSAAVFASLSTTPIAAASLGQVYRGRLRPELGGQEVAVKVQRPGVLKAVSLDLYLMRRLAVVLDRLFQTGWTAIIDEWSGRFFHELDYLREADNAMIFKEQMKALEGITVPYVYRNFCSRELLTTAWVEGVKLSESNAADVRKLCTTLLNCYLIQLLETGALHADPHPGNLLRTPDGKICILDFGLMTEIPMETRLALVEYIAHLTSENYAAIPGDLYKLGFIPEGAPPPEESGIVQPLSSILRQLSQGGGAKGINIEQIFGEMEELTRKFPFQIPSYFALILRAFSVIEGIALRADPTYAIVPECFPYISRRLFTDDSPRVRNALQEMLYGNRKRLDIGRLQRLAGGFGNFSVGGLSSPGNQQTPQGTQRILDDTAIEALRTLFREEGSFIQDVLVAESVAAVDAAGREFSSQLARQVLGSAPAMASLSFIRGLGPLRLVVLPLPTPVEVLSTYAANLEPTSEDEEALYVARTIGGLVQDNLSSRESAPPAGNNLYLAFQLAQELRPLLPELLPGIVAMGQLFVRSLIQRGAIRIAEEAGRRPNAATAGSFNSIQTSSSDLMASSPLWLVLPKGLIKWPPSQEGLLQWPHTQMDRNLDSDEFWGDV